MSPRRENTPGIRRVFISSTSQDLQPERLAIEHALRQMRDASLAMMEYFGSLPQQPKEICSAEVANSDVYVGVFAQRYGSIDPVSGLSMTELEYHAARQHGIPCLIYLKRVGDAVGEQDDPAARAKLDRLKIVLKTDHAVTFYNDPENLATRVVLDLHNLLLEGGTAPSRGVQESKKPVTPKELHIILVTRLSLDELKDLCFYLGVPYDHLPGDALPAKSRELIQYLASRQDLDRLIAELQKMRPDISW